MPARVNATRATRWLVNVAAVVVVVAGMRAVSIILVPFLLAAFIGVIVAPSIRWLGQNGVPKMISVLLVLTVLTLMGGGMVAMVGTSLQAFLGQLPALQARVNELTDDVWIWVESNGIDVPEETKETVHDYVNPERVLELTGVFLRGLGSTFGQFFLILLIVLFILLEMTEFPGKLLSLQFGDFYLSQITDFLADVRRYLAIKTAISALTGLGIALFLVALQVDYAGLWGLLAFLLNYIPNVGAVIASIPAVLLSLIQNGFVTAVLVAVVYLAVNNILGSVIEPRIMGRGLGLSPLVVLASLVFWGWVLGPVGMFLAVPLTLVVKIALASAEETRWIAVLLGSGVPRRPPAPTPHAA